MIPSHPLFSSPSSSSPHSLSSPSSTMASILPVSPPRTPRHSDISFTSSVHTLASERKYSTPPTTIPAHPSTSTISRDSQASAEDRSPSINVPSRATPFLKSPSATRLPKARVFLHRDNRPDRPRHLSSQSGLLTPTSVPKRAGVSPQREKRCVSDLHDAFQAHQLRVERSPTPAPDSWVRRRGITDEYGGMLGNNQHVPKWIPRDEADNWSRVPEYDPCAVEDEPSSRWANSLRQLSNLYRSKDKNPPCLRGSVLEVQPPTLTERLGLGVLGTERRQLDRDMPRRNAGRGRMNRSKRGKGRQDELFRRNSPTNVAFLPDDAEDAVEIGRDDYVGFLIEAPEDRVPRPRKSWLRFLRRRRA